jgi:hypothetical protein
MKQFYKVWFSNSRGERTAPVIVDTLQYPLRGTPVTEYSRLFPWPEARCMHMLHIGRAFDSWEAAFHAEAK